MRRRHRTGSSRTPSLIAVAVEVVAVVEELMAAVGLVGRDLADEVPLIILAIVVTWNDFVLVEVVNVVVDEVVEVVDVAVVAVVEVIDVVGVVDNLAVGLADEDIN